MNILIKPNLLLRLFLATIFAQILLANSFADELSDQNAGTERKSRFVEDRNPSAATFDKRLPPVIPGEEISDGKDKMNVWSTSGNVVAAEPPSVPSVDTDNRRIKPSIGVIVDQRQPK